MTERWDAESPVSPVGDHDELVDAEGTDSYSGTEAEDDVSIAPETIESDEEEDIRTIKADFSNEEINSNEVLNKFRICYGNVIDEFANVEIFLISMDGLLLELTAHDYLCWQLGCQSVVLAKQVDVFLEQLVTVGGKFKLIWFSDLIAYYEKDSLLKFIRSFVEAHLLQSCWASDVMVFRNILSPEWDKFLRDLTPSFLMISVGNISEEFAKESEYTHLLRSVALSSLRAAIPVVLINGLVVNITSVICHRIEPAVLHITNWEDWLKKLWPEERTIEVRSKDLMHCKNLAEFWMEILMSCKKGNDVDEFEKFASAILVFSLVSGRLGIERNYIPDVGNSRISDSIHKLTVLNDCAKILDSIDFQGGRSPNFNFDDLWDGFFIFGVYNEILEKKEVLPLRLQEEFAALHSKMKMHLSLPIDMDEHLFNPPVSDDVTMKSIVNKCLAVENSLLKEYVPEYEHILLRGTNTQESNLFENFERQTNCHVKLMPEEFANAKMMDKYEAKLKRKQLQHFYSWYEVFAQSLEGRGTELLVDFSRPVQKSIQERENQDTSKESQKKKKEGKGKKAAVKSKKELILEANKNKKNAKVLQDERVMIDFAVSQGSRACHFLEELLGKLKLPASQARCIYEQATALLRNVEELDSEDDLEARRICAVPLVGKLKELMTKYWDHLEDKPKDFVTKTWKRLGFVKNQNSNERGISLNMNMIYYQLAYGGELIDMESDPQSDVRVTGFRPDKWQREILDAVDRRCSAVVIAPTSAGKTFSSYYCIEKVLRKSDENVVVYISPSKALLNQVCGSVYARFRNKTMAVGKSLFGIITSDYMENPLNCQVLVTVPECLEKMLLSCDPAVREFVTKIKYAIFDEVHCINCSPESHIWEHLLLLIQSPFLALSATISNANSLRKWLQAAEDLKRKESKEVKLITYNERYSELELFLERIEKSLIANESENNLLQSFLPYAVFKPMKMSMFGIPADQQLTAKQILELYFAMSDVDPVTKAKFEPCKFFNFTEGEDKWLTRSVLRELENGLKRRLVDWLQNDEEKLRKVLDRTRRDIEDELSYRNEIFDQLDSALNSIVNVVLELREENRLPAICFIDNRSACVKLAQKLYDYFDNQEAEFRKTSQFRNIYAAKDEKKLLKLMKRKRDEKTKKKTKPKRGSDEDEEDVEEDETNYLDQLASLNLKMKNTLSKYRLHVRFYDEELVDRIKERMRKKLKSHKETTSLLLQLFDRGIAFHHEGLSSVERGSIEMLFRAGYLGVLFSTSTLALGVNMPCKSVLFGLDTPFLTPLLYRQMSGRAGRRGFDHSGNVVFMSIPTFKVVDLFMEKAFQIRRLLTASLSTLRGNFPFTTTYILRLFMFVYQVDETDGRPTEAADGIKRRLRAALALLQNPFLLYTRTESSGYSCEMKKPLEKQLKLFVIYSVQLLRWLGTLDSKGNPAGLAPAVAYLSEYEPGNLVFVYLLQKGVFHELLNSESQKSLIEVKRKLVIIFANLFTNVRLPPNWDPHNKKSYPSNTEATIFLQDFPDDCKDSINEYNAKVEQLCSDYLTLVGSDDKFHFQKNVFTMDGKSKFTLKSIFTDVIRPCDSKFLFDEGFFPACLTELTDYRGNKIYRNAYAYDFWVNRSKKLLIEANQIKERDAWRLIRDFNVVLKRITTILKTIFHPADPFRRMMTELSDEYDVVFKRGFEMKIK